MKGYDATGMNNTRALIGTLDTKSHIYAFIKRIIEKKGFNTLVIDIGILGKPTITPDISQETVAEAGGGSIHDLVNEGNQGKAI